MKLRSFILAGAAVLLATPAFAGQGWYLGIGAGWDMLKNPSVSGTFNGKLNTKDGALVVGALGYKFNNWRLELEPGWTRHNIESFDSSGGLTTTVGGHADLYSVLGNVIYDFPITDRLKLSLGAGAGVGNDRYKAEFPGGGFLSRGADRGFMWQGIGGLAYSMSPHVDFYVDYRYRVSQAHPSTTFIPAGFEHVGNSAEQAVIAGFRWYPESVERVAYQAPPMPPAPPPPPPPPVAPAPVKTFIVFFDFNKSNLTPEAVSVVGEAAKAAQQSGAVRILVTGHTDTVGSDSYNQALSERRAAAVKNQMIADGLGANEIATTGKSFHDPLVATGPNVREPQNRRAVIDLGG